jgi:hypothetical protein
LGNPAELIKRKKARILLRLLEKKRDKNQYATVKKRNPNTMRAKKYMTIGEK